MITGKNHLGFSLSAKGDNVFTTINPKNNKPTDFTFTIATEQEVNMAVQMAQEAFWGYKEKTNDDRATFLNAIAQEIENLKDALIETYCLETGLPPQRALGERGRTCMQLRNFAQQIQNGNWVNAIIDTALPNREPLPRPDLRKMLEPIGPIAVFGASNFPLAYSTAGGDTASALAAGCPVIVKSHPMHAGTADLVSQAITKAAISTNMPNGVFSSLNDSGIALGQMLVKHKLIKGVGFTGSINGGRALFDLAAKRPNPIPVFAEMGSINPVVVLPEILEEQPKIWAQKLADSISLGTGQFCTNPGLILAVKSEGLNEFTQHLGELLLAKEPSCMLHPNIANRYNTNKTIVVNNKAVEVVADYIQETPSNYAKQTLVKVSGTNFIENKNLQTEVFGPFSMVVSCENLEQLEQVIETLHGQLTGTLVGTNTDLQKHKQLLSRLKEKVGRILFNGVPTGVEVCGAMQHGGPYPASTDSRFGAVGQDAINRWVRPVSYQNCPQALLPKALQDKNDLGILRQVNGQMTNNAI